MSHTPHLIEQLLQQRILILDGATSAMIQRYKTGKCTITADTFKQHLLPRPFNTAG